MESLKEHEDNFFKRFNEDKNNKYWAPSNVACPECGEELLFCTAEMLASNPPQRKVKCSKCKYVGSMH